MTGEELQKATEINKAVAAAAAVPSFVFLPADAPPHVEAALREHAEQTRKQVMAAPAEGRVQRLAREAADRNVPAVPAGDGKAFLANIDAIAAGKIKVK